MAFTGAGVDPGLAPTLQVAVEVIAGKDYQAVKLVDGTVGSEAPVGVVANPLHVLDDGVLAALGTPLQAGGNVVVSGTVVVSSITSSGTLATGANQTNGTQKTQVVGPSGSAATVKPASTAALAADPALVVSVSPNSLLPAEADREIVASLTAVAQTATLLPLDGMSTATLDVSGTFVATAALEVTVDGTNWFPYFTGTSIVSNAGALITTGTTFAAAFQRTFSIAGLKGVRVRMTAFTSGTMVVVLRASAGVNVVQLGASLPQGTNAIGYLTAANSGPAPASFTATVSTLVYATSAADKLRTIMNDSDQDMLVMLSATVVTLTQYSVRVRANGGYFSTDFNGEIRAMMVAAIGSGQVLTQRFV